MRRILFLLPLLILVNGSCYYDYEEGAALSFYTAQGRLCQKWVLNSIWIDGIDSTGMSPYKELMGKWTIEIGRPDTEFGKLTIPSLNPANQNKKYVNRWGAGSLPRSWNVYDGLSLDNENKSIGVNIFFNQISYTIICLRKNRLVIEAMPRSINYYQRKTRLLFKTP